MSLQNEQINTLNKLIEIIDDKASQYKDQRFDMRPGQAAAEKKLIFDLIDDALKLASAMQPRQDDVLSDLSTLKQQLNNI